MTRAPLCRLLGNPEERCAIGPLFTGITQRRLDSQDGHCLPGSVIRGLFSKRDVTIVDCTNSRIDRFHSVGFGGLLRLTFAAILAPAQQDDVSCDNLRAIFLLAAGSVFST